MHPETLEKLDILRLHWRKLQQRPMRQLFAETPGRFEVFSLKLDDLLFDFSKNHIDDEALALLLDVANVAGVEDARTAMFAGQHINTTEDRAVMHMALRNASDRQMMVDGKDVMGDVRAVQAQMKQFATSVRNGEIAGIGGAFTDIVNIGIGGSDLGPVMVSEALSPYCDGPELHFVSNVDGDDLADCLAALNPATTLFIVASKTFTTTETLTNARSARKWLVKALGEVAVGQHFAALSTNLEATSAFGIDDDFTFGFWDWVGGRYSVWSAIGLSVMIGIGVDNFEQFLLGAHEVDNHFVEQPLATNIPVIMALIGVWHRNICEFSTHAVLPYAQHLHRFPAYLQQLDMETNGKSTAKSGQQVGAKTGPIVWGEPGTNGQHAFYQFIHQGSDIIPVDFLIAANTHHQLGEHHDILLANCFAQSEALMRGKHIDEVRGELRLAGMDEEKIAKLAPHKVFPGNRPSSTFVFSKLTPRTLGRLIALYEHKVFVQGVIWNINSFDQWGVELGKILASELLPMVKGEASTGAKDASTKGLVAHFQALKK